MSMKLPELDRWLVDKGMSKEEASRTVQRWTSWVEKKTTSEEILHHFDAVSTVEGIDQLIIVDNIEVDSICPHHLLPVTMRVHIGYLPNGKVLGLSKFARIAQGTTRAELQEEYTQRLIRIFGDNLNPKWAMMIVVGQHECMMHRGIKSRRSETVTSAVYNMEYDDGELKQEFCDFVLHNLRK